MMRQLHFLSSIEKIGIINPAHFPTIMKYTYFTLYNYGKIMRWWFNFRRIYHLTSEEYIMKCDMYIRYIWYVIYTDW